MTRTRSARSSRSESMMGSQEPSARIAPEYPATDGQDAVRILRAGGTVLDPFGGSGTTLIAAEKTGRIGWLIELDPKYVDVIVRRWQDWSGQEAYRELDAVKFNDLATLAGVAITTDAAEADA